MEIRIQELKNKVSNLIKEVKDAKTLENLRIQYLGRKGEITNILRSSFR